MDATALPVFETCYAAGAVMRGCTCNGWALASIGILRRKVPPIFEVRHERPCVVIVTSVK
jgi:hypothetical protein